MFTWYGGVVATRAFYEKKITKVNEPLIHEAMKSFIVEVYVGGRAKGDTAFHKPVSIKPRSVTEWYTGVVLVLSGGR